MIFYLMLFPQKCLNHLEHHIFATLNVTNKFLSDFFLIGFFPPMVSLPSLKTPGVFHTTWAMVNTHYMVDGHPIHNKDPKIMVIINPIKSPLDD